MSPIEKFTPEQEALMPVYREKWRAIIRSTEPIDRQKASEAIKTAYTAIGTEEPKILFVDSPIAALNTIIIQNQLGSPLWKQLSNQLSNQLSMQLGGRQMNDQFGTYLESYKLGNLDREDLMVKLQEWSQLLNQILSQFRSQLWSRLWRQLWRPVEESQLDRHLWFKLWEELEGQPGREHVQIFDEVWVDFGVWFDFAISVLNLAHEQRLGEVCLSLAKYCGLIFPFEKICFVCERPIKLSLDSEDRLHAVGEPAIQFADGYSLYAYHGVTLPEKYSKLHPYQWQAQWLLEEDNAEVRRVLIQGIGYARICQELQAIELDSWQEYTLLKIDADVDDDPIYLLKMTCPSTGFIHALRVPPDVESAREAIRWVNWGTDPEEFSVQT